LEVLQQEEPHAQLGKLKFTL